MTSTLDTRERLARLPVALRWVIAARLKTVGLSLTPVLCGSWLAAQQGPVRPGLAFAAGLSAMAIQIGTNLWNDAADAERGTDTAERLGPPRMTALGLLHARQVKAAAGFTFATALAAGLPLVLAGGWPIVLIGLLSLLLGYAYSMGPLPLSHTPLGEVIVLAFFGVIAVTGTMHVMGSALTATGPVAGIMMGLPSSAVLLLNNHRDRTTDAAAGRRTLAIIAGVTGSRLLYAVLVMSAALLLPLLTEPAPLSRAMALGAMAMAAALAVIVWRTPVSAAINRCLPLTVLFQFALFAALAMSGLAEG